MGRSIPWMGWQRQAGTVICVQDEKQVLHGSTPDATKDSSVRPGDRRESVQLPRTGVQGSASGATHL